MVSQPGFLDDPDSAFETPPPSHSVIERATRRRSWDPKNANLASIDFYSPFQALDPRFRDELGDWRVVILSLFGAAVHAPWAMALEQRRHLRRQIWRQRHGRCRP